LAEQQRDAAAIRRARQTLINLLLALGVSVGLLLTFVMIVPRDDSNLIKPVDYTKIAAEVRSSTGVDVLAPASIPDGWWSNSARWRDTTADGVDYWHVGFVGPENQYVGITQAFDTNPTWLALKVVEFEIVGETNPSEGVTLTEYRGRVENKLGEKLFILTSTANSNATIIGGTASRDEFKQFFNLVNLPFS
jgi:hypothetical protein